MIDVNLFGTINMVQAFLPGMKAARSGRIVNIASGFGLVSFPSMGAYCASKSAVVSYTEALSGELKRHGIKVNLVCPGITRTPFLDATDMKGYDDDARRKELLQRVLPLVSTTPEKLASFIVRAVKRDRRMVVHTWVAKAAYYGNRVWRGGTGAFLNLVYRVVTRMRSPESGAVSFRAVEDQPEAVDAGNI
jgi:short-subunit dehydrogenase